ncbi:Rab3-GAP regulatory subunit N-terminal domain-containing protein [Entamoeba marina]
MSHYDGLKYSAEAIDPDVIKSLEKRYSFNAKYVSFSLSDVVRNGILFWKLVGSTTYIHLFLINGLALNEFLSVFNYRGVVKNVCVSSSNPLTLTIMTENGIFYSLILAKEREQLLTVKRYDIKSPKPPHDFYLFDEQMYILFDEELRHYANESINETKKQIVNTLGGFKTTKSFSLSKKYFIVNVDLPKESYPDIGLFLNWRILSLSKKNAGIQIYKTNDLKPTQMKKNVTPFELAITAWESSNHHKGDLFACCDISGTYLYVYSVETSIQLEFKYFRGRTIAKVQQLLFSNDSKMVIMVSEKTIRFIPTFVVVPQDTLLDENVIYKLTFENEQFIRVTEMDNSGGEYKFLISTESCVCIIKLVISNDEIKLKNAYQFKNILQNLDKYKLEPTKPHAYFPATGES